MAAVLLALAVWLLRGEPGRRRTPKGHLVRRELTDRSGQTFAYDVPIRRGVAYSVVVGFVSSFLGIGGGVMHVSLLVRALGFPTHLATATSHFVLAIIAGSGALTHVIAGSFAHGHGLRRAISLSLGVVLGAQLGARLSLRASGRANQSRLRGSPVALVFAGLGPFLEQFDLLLAGKGTPRNGWQPTATRCRTSCGDSIRAVAGGVRPPVNRSY